MSGRPDGDYYVRVPGGDWTPARSWEGGAGLTTFGYAGPVEGLPGLKWGERIPDNDTLRRQREWSICEHCGRSIAHRFPPDPLPHRRSACFHPGSQSCFAHMEESRYGRYRTEKARILDMNGEDARRMLHEVVGTIYAALDDFDSVPEGLHPADIVSKHLQRGNISKDGDW